jgi:DegV family protein with EDD domain
MRDHIEMYFIVDTLDYLARGGRIGPVAHFAGGLLDMKPILTLKHGVVQSHARHRSWEKARSELLQLALSKCKGKKSVQMGVMHAMRLDGAKDMIEELKKKLDPARIALAEVGPAVGRHTGPGTLGVCWYIPSGDNSA